MNVGDVVGLVEETAGVLSKVPALVVKVYENVHGEVVADLHRIEANVLAVVAKEGNPAEAVPNAPHVTTDLAPLPSPAEQQQAAQVAAQQAPAPAQSAQLSDEETAFSKLSAEDQAAFLEWQANKDKSGSTTGTGEPTP